MTGCRTPLLGAWLLAVLQGVAWSAPTNGAGARSDQQEYWAHVKQHDWTAAVESAEQLVEAARGHPERPLALSGALSMLGDAQLAAENLVAAESAFTEALQLAEKHSNPTSEELLGPLRGLGHTLAAGGRHHEAVDVMERSLLVTHRSVGLFDTGQEGVLQELANSLTLLGRLEEARHHMTYLLRISEQAYEPGDPRRARLLSAYADWNAETGDMHAARGAYRAAIELIERAQGNDAVALVEPLRGLGHSYVLELYLGPLGMLRQREPLMGMQTLDDRILNPRQLSSDGERALLRALEIAEAADPPDPNLLARTLAQVGDWYQVKIQPDKALPFYRRAWQVATQASTPIESEGAQPGPTLLSQPVQVYYATPPLAVRHLARPPEQLEERYVEVEFTVTREGVVENERVIDRNGSKRQAAEALQAIRAARYRPRFVDGEPVDTPQLTRREIFRVVKKQ